MLNLKSLFGLKSIAAIATICCVAAPASAAIVEKTVETTPTLAPWVFKSTRANQTILPIVSTDGKTYQVAFESNRLSTVKFTNDLFLSESLDTTDMDRELVLADTSKRHQKLLFTKVAIQDPEFVRHENLRIMPNEVDRYLKSMKSQWKGILGEQGLSRTSKNYKAIKSAISLDGAAHHNETALPKSRIIVSKEYGDVRNATASKAFTNDSTLVQIIAFAFSKTALFTAFAVALIFSFFTRAAGRVRHA
jgi:hypothetical protein